MGNYHSILKIAMHIEAPIIGAASENRLGWQTLLSCFQCKLENLSLAHDVLPRGIMPSLRIALTLMLVLVFPAHATTRFTSDFGDLLKLAEAVVTVQITRIEVRENDSWLTTVVTARVTQSCKGQLKPDTELTVEFPGGENGTRRMIVPGQPRLTVGKSALLLLARNPSSGWRVVAGDAGQVNFSTDDDGTVVARRASGRFDYYVEDAASLSGYRAVSESIIPAATLSRLISAVVANGQPVLAAAPVASPQSSVQFAAIKAYDPQRSAFWKPLLLLLLVSVSAAVFALRIRRRARQTYSK